MGDSGAPQYADPAEEARAKGEIFVQYHPIEAGRLITQHEIFKDAMKRIVFAPVDLQKDDLQVMDSGTADGHWLVDLRQNTSGTNSSFVGADSFTKMFPRPTPDGIELHLQRADSPWPRSWLRRFDYVHQRLVLPGIQFMPLSDVVKNLCELVKPGGWIELLEQNHNSPRAGGLAKAEAMICEMFTIQGTGHDYGLRMKGWLQDAGMEDIHEQVFDVPVGPLNPNPEMAEKSVEQVTNAIKGFIPIARGLPVTMPRAELDTLAEDTEREMRRVGAVQSIYIVYARKPLHA
ncbi:unnamed protein product [Periconia digitata]|uniref:Methyltransferase n=1 Tax=Periconia digitata TaxID=1303443 RepID=A0A9W4UBS2_9PLEO|nr:unnamed protein product [Periconia digitata]